VSVASSELSLHCVEGFLVIKLLLVNAHPVEQTWWHDQFDDDSPDKREETEANADNLLVVGQWNSLEGTTSVVHKSNLDHDDEQKNDDESGVVAEVGEHVDLVVQEFSSVDHVEDLHHHKGLEDNGVHMAFVGWGINSIDEGLIWILVKPVLVSIKWVGITVWKVEPVTSPDQDNHQSNDLINSLTHDVSPHDRVDNLVVFG